MPVLETVVETRRQTKNKTASMYTHANEKMARPILGADDQCEGGDAARYPLAAPRMPTTATPAIRPEPGARGGTWIAPIGGKYVG